MAKRLQLRRGTATQHNSFTGAVGEVTYVTDTKTLRVHDGTTAGGIPVGVNDPVDITATVSSGSATVPVVSNGRCTISNSISSLTLTLPQDGLDQECIIYFTTSVSDWTLNLSDNSYKLLNPEMVSFDENDYVMSVLDYTVAFAPVGDVNQV